MRALECCGAVLLGIGGTELPTAERTARSLIDAAPLRESGYRLLMEILDARDDRSEALRTYERLMHVARRARDVSRSGRASDPRATAGPGRRPRALTGR
jgi:SARP family transcriptional regulator, regulator of embCAB operon